MRASRRQQLLSLSVIIILYSSVGIYAIWNWHMYNIQYNYNPTGTHSYVMYSGVYGTQLRARERTAIVDEAYAGSFIEIEVFLSYDWNCDYVAYWIMIDDTVVVNTTDTTLHQGFTLVNYPYRFWIDDQNHDYAVWVTANFTKVDGSKASYSIDFASTMYPVSVSQVLWTTEMMTWIIPTIVALCFVAFRKIVKTVRSKSPPTPDSEPPVSDLGLTG